MVAADYTITPSVIFSAEDTSGVGGVVGALFGGIAGAVAGGFNTSDASTVLTLIENRSGVQLAAAEEALETMILRDLAGYLAARLAERSEPMLKPLRARSS